MCVVSWCERRNLNRRRSSLENVCAPEVGSVFLGSKWIRDFECPEEPDDLHTLT